MPLDKILVGVFVIVLGILGLFVAARALDGYMYFAGLAVFFGACFFVIKDVKQLCHEKWGH